MKIFIYSLKEYIKVYYKIPEGAYAGPATTVTRAGSNASHTCT